MTPGEIRSAARIDDRVRAEARARVDGLAKPLGALGRLEDAMVWLAGVQGTAWPHPPRDVSVVVFAGDHGVTADESVSAYPREVTALMVREFLRGGAAVNVLARAHGARVRVLDLGVDDDLAETPDDVRRHARRAGLRLRRLLILAEHAPALREIGARRVCAGEIDHAGDQRDARLIVCGREDGPGSGHVDMAARERREDRIAGFFRG